MAALVFELVCVWSWNPCGTIDLCVWTILSINSEYKEFSHFLIHLIDEVCQDRHEGDLTQVNSLCSGLSKTKFWSEAFLRVNKLGERICSKGKCSHFTVCVCKWNGQWEGWVGSSAKTRTELPEVRRAQRLGGLEKCVLGSFVFCLFHDIPWLGGLGILYTEPTFCIWRATVGCGSENPGEGLWFLVYMLFQLLWLEQPAAPNSMVLKRQCLFYSLSYSGAGSSGTASFCSTWPWVGWLEGWGLDIWVLTHLSGIGLRQLEQLWLWATGHLFRWSHNTVSPGSKVTCPERAPQTDAI